MSSVLHMDLKKIFLPVIHKQSSFALSVTDFEVFKCP